MLVNTDYQQSPLLFVQTGGIEKDTSTIYQSFLNHENFYKSNYLSFMHNETAQRKINGPDIKLNYAVCDHQSSNERSGKRFHSFEHDIVDSAAKREKKKTEKKWKCPYCHYWWLIGDPCKNPECPAKKW